MKTISQFMGEDHDRLDALFQNFQKTKGRNPIESKRSFSEFNTGLQRHIVWEEEILFPVFEERTAMKENGPTAVMRIEHRQIKGFLENIHDCLMKGQTKTEAFEKGLVEVLSRHNQKEENILYPWIDDFVDEEEREGLFSKMRQLPEEKYCHCCGGRR